jgi:hypothetical protein
MQTQVMETTMQGLVIVGGLTFSLAVSLLIEELIFGRIVRLAFERRPTISRQYPKTGAARIEHH